MQFCIVPRCRRMPWNLEHNLRTGAGTTTQLQVSANALDSFLHTNQSVMSHWQRRNFFGIKPCAVIQDPQTAVVFLEVDVELDLTRVAVPYGVVDGLAHHHEKFMDSLLLKLKRLAPHVAFHRHAKLAAHFLSHFP